MNKPFKQRIYNFSAGPCSLPLEVLEEAQAELVNYKGIGSSLLEISHRGPVYEPIHMETRALALELWGAPDDFDVLFLQGGASKQFSMLPMNLLNEASPNPNNQQGAYVHTGHWANAAIADAEKVADIYCAWHGEKNHFLRTPTDDEIKLKLNTRYLHICSNETINGLRWAQFPDCEVPIVADMSSEMLAREIPWDKFDIIFGGAQKNLGPAGVTLVYIRKSILKDLNPNLPRTLSYQVQQASFSLANTPPVFSIWMVNKVLHWIKRNGGVSNMQALAKQRAELLYGCIDDSAGFYHCPINTANRSRMNAVFRLPSLELELEFVALAAEHELMYLRGHKAVGGIRASMYNAMPLEGVKSLVQFMRYFEEKNG